MTGLVDGADDVAVAAQRLRRENRKLLAAGARLAEERGRRPSGIVVPGLEAAARARRESAQRYLREAQEAAAHQAARAAQNDAVRAQVFRV